MKPGGRDQQEENTGSSHIWPDAARARKVALLLRILVSLGAVVAVGIHHWLPSFHADAFTGTFLLVAVLPWLAPLLESIKLPGGLEIKYRALHDEVKGWMQSAQLKAQVLPAVRDASRSQPRESFDPPPSPERLLALGRSYEKLRDSLPSGHARTKKLTDQMVDMLREAEALAGLDFEPLVRSQSRGERLVAYAYAYTHPSAADAASLVEALVRGESTAFGQYWAILALQQVAESKPSEFPTKLCEQLKRYRQRQSRDSDRYYELTQLLKDLNVPLEDDSAW